MLEITASRHWRLPLSQRIESDVPHHVPSNVTWRFVDHQDKAFEVPVFQDRNATINPVFERLFLTLFKSVAAYLDRQGWSEQGSWAQVADEPTWTDDETRNNILALNRLYKRVSPHVKIYQTRFPLLGNTSTSVTPEQQQEITATVDWYCLHVCQWETPGVSHQIAWIRQQRRKAKKEFHATVYDNGVPIIESSRERLRFQALDVFNTDGLIEGTLSWYSINSYGTHLDPTTGKRKADPWLNPYPTTEPGKVQEHPAGFGYLVLPPPPDRRVSSVWSPIETVRWVMLGAGIQDAEYLYALKKQAPRSERARKLLDRAHSLASAFPGQWNPSCPPGKHAPNWGDDGYEVDTTGNTQGSSVVNEWKLAMGSALAAGGSRR